MGKLLVWFDKNILFYICLFLLVIIPLYPKLPILEIIPGYIVRVRLEDFVIALSGLVLLIQTLRGKAKVDHPLSKWMVVYMAVGAVSVILGVFILKTIPMSQPHVLKAVLHWARNGEYLLMAFIFYAGVRTKKDVLIMIKMMVAVLIAVSLYGFGQKYLYWPVYSTMNREFATGMRLYLTENARVPSTFGGHYDLAAFVMMSLAWIVALFFALNKKVNKIWMILAFIFGLWILVLTASRSSALGYLLGVSLVMIVLSIKHNWKWFLVRWGMVMAISLIVLLAFGDLSNRFAQILKLDVVAGVIERVMPKVEVEKPENGMGVDELDLVTDPSDTPPSPVRPGDVYEDIPDIIQTETGELIYVPRVYSEAAHKYGLSVAIRLDTLWPRAIEGLKRNWLFGSGYSTLTKGQVDEFTFAESTDNNFLRTLGETGLLGFISFYGMLVYLIKLIWNKLNDLSKGDKWMYAYSVGMLGVIAALLVNALYIDVFVASKVAEPFWAMVGILLAILAFPKTKVVK